MKNYIVLLNGIPAYFTELETGLIFCVSNTKERFAISTFPSIARAKKAIRQSIKSAIESKKYADLLFDGSDAEDYEITPLLVKPCQ